MAEKKLPGSADDKRDLIEAEHAMLSWRRQCELIGLSRTAWYYELRRESVWNLQLMRLIDKQFLQAPIYGVPRVTEHLRQVTQQPVNEKRVRRLMRLISLQAICPKPHTILGSSKNQVLPYLLRNVAIVRVNQVLSSDITYVPMRQGFMYLVAILDWYSQYVLACEVANTLEGEFCLAALERALQHGKPEIFNPDQGVQFTARAFTDRLRAAGIRISMDGRGRAFNNIFIERLWRTVKYEDLYLHNYETVADLLAGLARYWRFYNHERLHQSLGDLSPAQVHKLKDGGISEANSLRGSHKAASERPYLLPAKHLRLRPRFLTSKCYRNAVISSNEKVTIGFWSWCHARSGSVA